MNKRLLITLSIFSILCSFAGKTYACGSFCRRPGIGTRVHFSTRKKESSPKKPVDPTKGRIGTSIRREEPSTNKCAQVTQDVTVAKNARSGQIGFTHDSIRTMYGTKPLRGSRDNTN